MEPHAKLMQALSHLQRRHPLSLLSEGRDGGKKVNKYIKASSPAGIKGNPFIGVIWRREAVDVREREHL